MEYSYTFKLSRKSGKNSTLAKGNQMISANDRMHFAPKMKITKFLRDLAHEIVTNDLHLSTCVFSPDRPCLITIIIAPPSNRRMDPPNWYPTVKALIDGMTDAKLWTDDNHEILRAMTFIYGTKTNDKLYHITIKIKDVDDDTGNNGI